MIWSNPSRIVWKCLVFEFQGIEWSPGVVDQKRCEAGSVLYNLNWKTLLNQSKKRSKPVLYSILIDNDANVALGIVLKGAGENQPDVVFMTLGTGAGGGIVASKSPCGARSCCELGHITVDFDDPIQCTCGVLSWNGCPATDRQLDPSLRRWVPKDAHWKSWSTTEKK